MANFAGTSGDDFFAVTGGPGPAGNNYLGGDGNDTYLITPFFFPANSIANIIDNKGTNIIQLNDGLQIASSQFLADGVQLTLNNGAKVIIPTDASTKFNYQVGANATINDTAPNQTFAQFASTLGAAVPGSGAAYTVPTGFSILATVEFGSTTFSAQEGNSGVKVFQIPVTISPPQPNPVTFKATTTALSATDFLDFTPFANKVINIPANTASTTIDLTVVTDTVPEPDEDLKITISDPSANIAIGSKNVVTVTILNDDTNVAPTVTTVPASPTVTAAAGVNTPLNVNFTVADPDDNILTFEISGSNGSVRLDDSGLLTYTGGYSPGTSASQIKGSGSPINLSVVLDTLKYTSFSPPNSTDTVTVKVKDLTSTTTSTINVNVVPSLILTTGSQNLVGTAGPDLFISDGNLPATDAARLVQGSDQVDGSGGNDTLFLDAANVTGTQLVVAAPPNVKSIENLVITSDNTAAQTYTLNASNVGGLQKIFWQGDSGDSLKIDNLKPTITTTLTKSINGLTLDNAAINPVNLVLDGGASGITIGTLTTGIGPTNEVNKVNLESKGTGTNKVTNTSITVATPTDYVITGSANLELATAGLDAKIQNLDASAFTGNLKTKIGNITAAGSYTFEGGSGNDTIDGSLVVTAGVKLNLIGNAGNDRLISGSDADTIDGGAGADTLRGNAGNDTLLGGDGNDSLVGDADNDSLLGGDGDDTLDSGASIAFDTLDGGPGIDVITLGGGVQKVKLTVGEGGSNLLGIADADNSNTVTTNDIFVFTGKIDTISNFASGTDNLNVDIVIGGNLALSALSTTLVDGKGYFVKGTYQTSPQVEFKVDTVSGPDTLVVVGNGVPLRSGTSPNFTFYTTASYFVLLNATVVPNDFI